MVFRRSVVLLICNEFVEGGLLFARTTEDEGQRHVRGGEAHAVEWICPLRMVVGKDLCARGINGRGDPIGNCGSRSQRRLRVKRGCNSRRQQEERSSTSAKVCKSCTCHRTP